VEVAAYRIAVAVLTNAARHSGGRSCHLELPTGQLLRLVITGDGHGLASRGGEGVGIRTMRERARELGGQLTPEDADGAGRRVVAELPTPTAAIVMVRVLIAEDHPTFRDPLQTTLTLTGGFEVAARLAPASTP